MIGIRRLQQVCFRIESNKCLRLIQTDAASAIKEQASFQLTHYKLHKLESGPQTETTITRSDALTYYRHMKSIRNMEEAVLKLFQSNHIRGQSHLATGQEGCAVGMWGALEKDDVISTSHRNHAWAYLKGLSMHQILAEITGRSTGSSKGKGGSMHLYKRDSNFFGGSAIVGSQVPLGAGMALAMKSLGRSNISAAFYGDGAANQGQVAESFNLSKIWDLPVIFVCENNQVARNAEVDRTTACSEFYTRGDYVPGIWVDGMDILTVREATRWAARYCRDGYGPIVLEMDTCHFHDHAATAVNYDSLGLSDDEDKRDPIRNFANQILGQQLCLPDELREIDRLIALDVSVAVEKARIDPEPNVSETYTTICAGANKTKVRGCDEFSFHNSQ